nr:hypothetical protein [Tanacetum cinerariifolium]
MFTTIGHKWRPTRQTFTLVGNVCPLTWITTTAIVPLRKPIPIESNTTKPVVTLVYSKKSKAAKKKVPLVQIVLWYLDSGCSKHMTGDRSQLINFVQKFLGKLQPKADIGIFIGYAQTKKAFRICNRRTRRIVETIHVDFDELTAMASEQSSLGPALNEMTPTTISSGVVKKPSSSTPYVPPSRNDWDLMFQPMFDELLNPSPSVDPQAPKVLALIADVIPPIQVNQSVCLLQLQLIKMHLHQVNLKEHQKRNLLSFLNMLKKRFMILKLHT